MKYMLKALLAMIMCLAYGRSISQADSSAYLIGAYYGVGVASPLGSFSENDSKFNAIGKARLGLNMKAGLEIFLTAHDAISLDLDYGFYFGVTNDSLEKTVKRNVNSYKTPYISAGSGDGDIILSHICVGYSRFIYFGRFILQPKLCVGLARFSYDFSSGYLFSNALSGTITPISGITTNSVAYSIPEQDYFTLKPEVTLKYILKKGRNVDINLGLGVSYFYARPTAVLVEEKGEDANAVLRLKDKIQSLNFNLGINVVLKRSLFGSLFK